MSSFLPLAAVCLFCILQLHPASASSNVWVAFSKAPLLSGSSLTACTNATAGTCTGGLAAAAAYLRQWRGAGQRLVFLPKLDHTSLFAQMARPQWSVNIPIFQRFGFANYWAVPSLLTDERPANEGLLQADVTFTAANLWTLASHRWFGYYTRAAYQERVAVIPLVDETQPNCDDVIASLDAAVADAWRRWDGQLDFTVVLHQSASDLNALADAVESMQHPPDIVLYESPPANFKTGRRRNTTFLLFDVSDAALTRLNVTYSMVGGRAVFESLQVMAIPLTVLPGPPTTEYLADQAYLQALATAALAFNPTRGTSAAPMPVTRAAGTKLNTCMAGECPLGNLYTDAYRWRFGADIAFSTCGGLRGPGWPAGPINVSDVWAAMPFANNPCTATLLGLTVWELLNHSLALATFTAAIQGTSDRLLQVSGLRVTYNPALSPTSGRITQIEAWSEATQRYVPLERLRAYTVATDSFLCASFDAFPAFFRARYPEETAARLWDGTCQDLMASYLQGNSPIYPGISGRLIPTTGTDSLAWRQTMETCPADTIFNASVATCMACPAGTHQPDVGQSACLPVPQTSVVAAVVAAVAGAVGAVLLGGGVALVCRHLRKRRNLALAPHEGKVTFLFTDVKSSCLLWGLAPKAMSVSLDLHHCLIRQCIGRHRAYEVKTVGDSFMIAVGTAQVGVDLAMDIELALQQHAFPAAIQDIYDGRTEEIKDDAAALAPLHPLWNGLRVRISVHTGEPTCIQDEATAAWDYYGPDVNMAAGLQQLAAGGQVLVSGATHAAYTPSDRVDVRPMGSAKVKGMAEAVEVYQVLPQALAGRSEGFDNRRLRQATSVEAEGALDAADAEQFDDNVAALLDHHPLVAQHVMSRCQLEQLMDAIAQVMQAVLRALPEKALDVAHGALRRAWHVAGATPSLELLQTIVLRTLSGQQPFSFQVSSPPSTYS
eukprot:EG_transcript_1577